MGMKVLAQLTFAALAAFLSCTVLAAVGATTGSFGVSQTGAAQYSIRIFTPPGAGSMAPSLALSYSSDSGDGLAGAGFQISGLSQITRCNKTLAQDNVRAAAALQATDRFCLDGNKLRLVSGTYGSAASVYRTEVETFTRVTAYGTAGTGPEYFIAELKNGLKYEYGNSTDSRIEPLNYSGGQVSTARVWALNKIYDRSGNTIEFTYIEDLTNGSFRPDEVRWATNSTQGITTAPYVVKFVYETTPRPDILYGYRFGTQSTVKGDITETHRLDRVDVLYNASTVIRRYELTYESTGGAGARSRLQSI
jgi:virulence plasmid B protein